MCDGPLAAAGRHPTAATPTHTDTESDFPNVAQAQVQRLRPRGRRHAGKHRPKFTVNLIYFIYW